MLIPPKDERRVERAAAEQRITTHVVRGYHETGIAASKPRDLVGQRRQRRGIGRRV